MYIIQDACIFYQWYFHIIKADNVHFYIINILLPLFVKHQEAFTIYSAPSKNCHC